MCTYPTCCTYATYRTYPTYPTCCTCCTHRTCRMTHRGHGYTFLHTEWCVLERNDWDLSSKCKKMQQSESTLLGACVLNGTCRARSRKSETRTCRRNCCRLPRWVSQFSFQTARLKRELIVDRQGFRFPFRRPFRVSSFRERAV